MIAVRGTGMFVDADSVAGFVYLGVPSETPPGEQQHELTVPQSAQLRALLERAEQVVSSGIGDMKERP